MAPRRAAALSASKSLREPSSSPEPEISPQSSRSRNESVSGTKRPPPSRNVTGPSAKKALKIKHLSTPSSSKTQVIELLDSSDESSPEIPPILDLVDNAAFPEFCNAPVWVHLRLDGSLASSSEGETEDTFWWPAGVTRGSIESANPITVFLLSPLPGSETRILHISSPGPTIVLPKHQPGRVAFSFTLSTYWQRGQLSSDTNGLKTSLDRWFPKALERMRAAYPAMGDSTDEDELPTFLSTDGSLSGSQRFRALSPLSSDGCATIDTWEPPGPDDSLTIPGEAVLAIWKNRKNVWWPARVVAYLPPSHKNDKPKYRLTFFDDNTSDVPREHFYTWLEGEFHKCKVGQYESSERSQVVEDIELGEEGFVPVIPAPPPNDFILLPMRHQFAYTLPVLQAIISNRYFPARARHEKFILGGLRRSVLRREATAIGDMTTATAQAFWKLILSWALGSDSHKSAVGLLSSSEPPFSLHDEEDPATPLREASTLVDVGDATHTTSSPSQSVYNRPHLNATSSLSRPKGCEEYEALSLADRIEYCSLVLDHEATIQLLLWRHGKRRSLDLLSDEEEKVLRDEGEELAAWTDVAEQIEHLRSLSNPQNVVYQGNPSIQDIQPLERSRSLRRHDSRG